MSAGRINQPTIIQIHGAANSSLVWTFWQREFAQAGFPTNAIDLQGHEPNSAHDLSQTGMRDYVKDIHEACKQLEQIPILIGWSMGGLLARRPQSLGQLLALRSLRAHLPVKSILT